MGAGVPAQPGTGRCVSKVACVWQTVSGETVEVLRQRLQGPLLSPQDADFGEATLL